MAKRKRQARKSKEEKSLKGELVKQMTTLTTSGFSLVAALAWNEAIQGFVKEYIERYFPSSALWLRFVYAIFITFLVVFVTYQLARVASHIQNLTRKKA